MAGLFAAICAGLVAVFFCVITGSESAIYITCAIFSAAFWAAILGKRITDVSHICTYLRAALLGVAVALLTVLSVTILMGIELRLEIMLNGLESVQQTMRYTLIEGLSANPASGYFTIHIVGAYFGSIGAIAGMLLRWLRTLYELDEQNELYEGDDRPNLHSDDE